MMSAPHGTGICPTFIGRQFDLTALRLLVDRLSSGQGQVALLSGEAGIGKSRLVAETQAYAATHAVMRFQGICFQTDRLTPYAPLLDLFRAYATQAAAAPLDAQVKPLLAELAQLLPELSLLFPDLLKERTLPLADSEQQKRRLFALMTQFFTGQAAQQPVLVVVEDVHWCDELSLDYLLHLARRSQRLPLLLLVTYRDEEARPELRRWLANLDRERLAQEFPLERLPRGDVAAMLHAILELRQGADADLLDMLYTRSEGNPFFIEELLKSLMTSGELEAVDGVWRRTERRASVPRSVQEAVRQRTATLSAEARRLLTVASVAGRRFNITLLREIIQCDEEQVLTLLKEVIAAQLVSEESAERFAFRHVLTQQAIYTELLLRERQALHRSIAETLERLVAQGAAPERALEDLAYHCHEAGMWQQALVYAQQMGEKALALYAQQAAIVHLTHAVDAAHHLHQAPPARLYLLRGQAYEALGVFDHARGDYERALGAACAAHESDAEWQSLLALGFLWSGRAYEQAGDWFRQALDLAERLDDPLLRARSLNRLGNWLVNTGWSEEGLLAHHEALSAFAARNETRGTAETLDLLGTAYGLAGDRVQSDHYLAQAIALFRSLDDAQSLTSILANRAIQSTWETTETLYHALRTPAENLQDATESLRLAQQTGSLSGQSFAEITLAFASSFAGEIGQALSHAREGLRLARAIEHRQWMVFASYTLASHYLLLLQPALARATLESEAPLARELGSEMWTGVLTALQGMIALHEHDLRQAEATLSALLPSEQSPATFSERQIAWVWGELALAQGQPERALQRAKYLLATAPGESSARLSQPIPHLLRLQGEALLALTRFEEAAQALAEAQRGAETRRDQAILWRVHQSSARLYLRMKAMERAHAHADAAQQIIESHAATIDDAPLRERFLQAALASLPFSQRLPVKARHAEAAVGSHTNSQVGGLTTREREVAALVAQGCANREIAARLVVSERTAEAHVSNILGKLGFTTRAQIAVWAVEHGLIGRVH